MRTQIVAAFISLALVAIAERRAEAVGVVPLVLELRSGGEGRTAQIVVNNDTAANSPIELDVQRVEIGEDGQQLRIPASADFVVVPPMRLIPPHSKQVFKIQWANTPLAKSQSYSLMVFQPHVKLPDLQGGVQVDYQFEVLVFVGPPSGGTRTLDVQASSVTAVGGKRYASVLIGNSGNVQSFFSDATITLRSGSWSRTVLPTEMLRLVGVGTVQPGKKRRFILPVELPAAASSVTADILYGGAPH
jgi:fimbrial chaperone protein